MLLDKCYIYTGLPPALALVMYTVLHAFIVDPHYKASAKCLKCKCGVHRILEKS